MNRRNLSIIFLTLLCLSMFALTGCISKSDYEALEAELESQKNINSTLTSEKSALSSEVSSLESDLQNLQAQYDAKESELEDIKDTYPPRDFDTVGELRNWLLGNGISDLPITPTIEEWYLKALDLQYNALLDGYIISVDYDYDPTTDTISVWCVARINGYLWIWDPETDDVYEDIYVGETTFEDGGSA